MIHPLYAQDIDSLIQDPAIPWDSLKGKAIVLSGGTGLVGRYVVDAVLEVDSRLGLDCSVYALCRQPSAAKSLFPASEHLHLICHDVNNPVPPIQAGRPAYVLHLASNTHPVAYATDPIGTIMTNVMGLRNMLEAAVSMKAERFVFSSSNEVYGENRGDEELFTEKSMGYIDCNTLRAGYPESKRCGEALCQAYRKQYGLEVVIPRLTRSFGPTMKLSDTKAMSQFLLKALNGENIVLKSEGKQFYSFTYSADAARGLLIAMLRGQDGEAYNIAHQTLDITLRDLAALVAEAAGTEVVFDLPDTVEAAGFSKATKARLDGSRIMELGWKPRYSLESGIERTLQIIKDSCNTTT